MKACEAPVFERNFVIEADEFHQHVADEEHQILHVTGLVIRGHDLGR